MDGALSAAASSSRTLSHVLGKNHTQITVMTMAQLKIVSQSRSQPALGFDPIVDDKLYYVGQ